MTAVAKLLPCPFCGDDPTMHTWSDHGYVRIECKSCNFEWDYFHTPSDAAEAWNRRAALSPAELDGTELPVGEVSDGFIGHQRAVNLYGPIRCQPSPGTKLYTTPRAAEGEKAE